MNVYVTDGTEKCFYTAAFAAYADKDCVVTPARRLQLRMGAQVLRVETDEEKSARVLKKVRACDKSAPRDISLILRRGCDGKEMTALGYLRLLVREGGPVRSRLAHPAVIEAMEERRKVTLEAHRFTGFLRFTEGEGGVFYAPFSPDNDVLELILPHFMKRLASQPFVIHDVSRKKAALYNGKDCLLVQTEREVLVPQGEREEFFRNLWQEYYRSVNIAARPHERQMKGYMPVRYWKFLPEKQ